MPSATVRPPFGRVPAAVVRSRTCPPSAPRWMSCPDTRWRP